MVAISGGFHIEDWGAVHGIETPDGQDGPVDLEEVHNRNADPIGPSRGAQGEDPSFRPARVPPRMLERLPIGRGVEVEQDQDLGLVLEAGQTRPELFL